MSDNMLTTGLAAHIENDIDPGDRDELMDALYEVGASLNYEGDIVYVRISHESLEESYGVHTVPDLTEAHKELSKVIEDFCLTELDDQRKVFFDIWYNGTDSNIDMATWKELE